MAQRFLLDFTILFYDVNNPKEGSFKTEQFNTFLAEVHII